jgi:hypothetical protein
VFDTARRMVGRRSPQGDAAIIITIIEDDLTLKDYFTGRCQAPGRFRRPAIRGLHRSA